MLIFFLEEIIDALQRFGFQLVDHVVKNLKARDVDNAIVIRWVWNLDADSENSDENRGQVRTGNECVVGGQEAGLRGDFLKHSENHSNKGPYNVNFIHDATNKWVFSGEMKLVLFQRIVQGKNIGIKWDHLLVNHVVEFSDANFHDFQLNGVLSDRKHDLGQHKWTF